MKKTIRTIKGQRKDGSVKGIRGLFQMFSSAAMNPKKYVKRPMPASVTVTLEPKEMETLCLIAARIGAPRATVGHHILKMGLYEAAFGCGFTPDEDGNIPEDEKGSWDFMKSRTGGFSFVQDEKEESENV